MTLKRETILFYMTNNKIYLYRSLLKKENIIDTDTSTFFSFGEIKDVEECQKCLRKILSKINLSTIYLKPNFIVLYNDVCNSDIKFLYKEVLKVFDYNKVKFISLSVVTSKITHDENLVIFDHDYYTLVSKEKKLTREEFDFNPIMIGKSDNKYIHYSDIDIIWKKFLNMNNVTK